MRMTKAEKARRGRQLHFWRGRLREAYLRLQALDPEIWTPAGLAAEMEAEDQVLQTDRNLKNLRQMELLIQVEVEEVRGVGLVKAAQEL
jgi:hypothetical protein